MSDVRTVAALSNQPARRMLDAALSAAEPTGRRFAIAVVDGGGHLNAFARMDGAPLMAIQIAIDKAYTAAGFGLPDERRRGLVPAQVSSARSSSRSPGRERMPGVRTGSAGCGWTG